METKLKTPFRCAWSEHLSEWRIRDCDGHQVAVFETEAEAREAVDALNSHIALTSALDGCVEALEPIASWNLKSEMSGVGPDYTNKDTLLDTAITLSRAALAAAKKAKG